MKHDRCCRIRQTTHFQPEEQEGQNPFVFFIFFFLHMEDTLFRMRMDPVFWASTSQMPSLSLDSRQLLRLSTAYKEEALILLHPSLFHSSHHTSIQQVVTHNAG